MCKNYDLVYGIDNNEREKFFGLSGSTLKVKKKKLTKNIKNYIHLNIDITKNKQISDLIEKLNQKILFIARPNQVMIMHQKILRDYNVNATSTINLMESVRNFSKKTTVVFFNK